MGRNVRLTEYGEEFNKHICCALDEIDKAVEIMKAYNSGLSGRIRIGTVISIQRNYLPRLLSSFKGAFGDDVVFDIYQGTTSECLKGLADGKFDVVFCGKMDRFDDIEFVPQFSQNVVLAVNSHHELADREMVSLNDLKGIPLPLIAASRMHVLSLRVFSNDMVLRLSRGLMTRSVLLRSFLPIVTLRL